MFYVRKGGLMNSLPIARCGLFGIREDHIESYQSLDERFIKQKSATFFFKASGTSMEPLIFAKDILVVDRSLDATNNRIIIAALNGEFLCKRILKSQNKITLISENPKQPIINITADFDFSIFGVVTSIIREV